MENELKGFIKAIFGFVFLLIFSVSCTENRLDVNIDDVQVDIDFLNFDKGLVEARSEKEFKELNKKARIDLGLFYESYLFRILQTTPSTDPQIGNNLASLSNDKYVRSLLVEQLKIENRTNFDENIVEMFQRLKFHVPSVNIPTDVVYWNSLYTNSVVSSDSCIGIGLERYLGNSKLYDSLPNPPHYEYVKEKYNSRYLFSDVAKSWLLVNLFNKENSKTFLERLVFEGKVMYLVDAMLPNSKGADKLRFSDDDYAWAEDKERITWEYMVKNNLIYSTDPSKTRDFFNIAPFTQGLPEKAPGQVGVFIGWRIVKSYMDKNPKVSIQDLIDEKDNQKILKGYKINE